MLGSALEVQASYTLVRYFALDFQVKYLKTRTPKQDRTFHVLFPFPTAAYTCTPERSRTTDNGLLEYLAMLPLLKLVRLLPKPETLLPKPKTLNPALNPKS